MGRTWRDSLKPYTTEELAQEYANKQRWIAEDTARDIAALKLSPEQWQQRAAVEIIASAGQTSEAETMQVEDIVAIINRHFDAKTERSHSTVYGHPLEDWH